MPRFIFRFKGVGTKPVEDVRRIRTQAGTKILEESERMLLVDASTAKAEKLQSSLQDWSVCTEQSIPLPDPQQKLRRQANL